MVSKSKKRKKGTKNAPTSGILFSKSDWINGIKKTIEAIIFKIPVAKKVYPVLSKKVVLTNTKNQYNKKVTQK